MTDRREQICARLPVIAAGITGIAKVARNQADITGKAGGAIVVWDGDETVDPDSLGRRRPPTAPLLVDMSTEVRILLGEASATVGTTLNTRRAALIKAVLADAELLSIVTNSGEIRYEGCSSELARGRSMQAEMALNFGFRYPLVQGEL